MSNLPVFHLALHVNNIEEARNFYTTVLGCQEIRSSEAWIDLDFYGHQLILHRDPMHKGHIHSNIVEGRSVPVPHFGVLIEWAEFDKTAKNLHKAKARFVIEPYVRKKDERGEEASMFFMDPSGNTLEFKARKD